MCRWAGVPANGDALGAEPANRWYYLGPWLREGALRYNGGSGVGLGGAAGDPHGVRGMGLGVHGVDGDDPPDLKLKTN